MIDKIKADYAKFIATRAGAIINRVVIVGLVAFGASFVPQALEVHLFTVPVFFNLSAWHIVLGAALYAAGTAALTLVQSLLSTLFSSLHAPQLTRVGQIKFAARRTGLGLAA